MASAVRFGGQRAGAEAVPQLAGDEGQADAEAAGDLPLRALVVVDGGGDTLSEVERIGFHDAPPRKRLPSFMVACQPAKGESQ